MNKFIEKFFAIQNSIADEKGTIRLLVLLEPNEFQGKWEMVLSAEWLPESTRKAFNFIIDKMSAVLDSREYYQVANITLLHTHEPFVQAFEQLLEENPHQREFVGIEVDSLEIKRAYVIAPQIYTFEEEWLKELQAKTHQLETEVRSLLEFRNQWREILELSAPNKVYDLSPSEWNTAIPEFPRTSRSTETRPLSMSDKPSNQIMEKINKQ
jgi:hypothetical protein